MTAPTAPEGRVVPPSGVDPAENEFLRPYVPRLVVDWLRTDPTQLHREVEATLVFVDISGFTALTERLARKGKVGAELMRDTLDGVFTRAPRRGLRLGRRPPQVGRRCAAPDVRRPRTMPSARPGRPGRCRAPSIASAGCT